MTIVRELVTVFGFQPDEQGLDAVEGAIGSLRNGLAAVAAAAAAGAATIYGIASSVAEFGDETIKTAQRIGLTAESLQQLDFALQISGTSMQQQRASFVRLARTANDASQGIAEYADIYDTLGVSVTDANGDLKGSEELILDLSDSFAAMPDGIEKTALAAELFGRKGTEMLQFLNAGSDGIRELMNEATELGGVLSTEAAQDSEVLNDTLHRLKTSVNGLRLSLGAELIPVVSEVIQGVLDFVTANREVLSQRLSTVFSEIAKMVGLVGRTMFRLVSTVERVVSALGGLRQIIDGLIFALTVLAVRTLLFTVVPALVAFVGGLSVASIATAALAAKAWLLNAAVAAIPLAISAIIVLVAIMADDFRRFFNGQDSLIGRLLDKYGEATEGISGFFGAILRRLDELKTFGPSVFGFLVDSARNDTRRMAEFFERMGLRIHLMFDGVREGARDVLDVLGRIPGINVGRSAAEEAADESAVTQRAAQLAAARAGARRRQQQFEAAQMNRAIDASSSMQVEVNVNGGNPEEVQEAVLFGISEAMEQRQRELLRSLGLPMGFAGGSV